MIICGLFLVLAPYNQMFGVLLGFCEVIRHGQWERGQTNIEYKNQMNHCKIYLQAHLKWLQQNKMPSEHKIMTYNNFSSPKICNIECNYTAVTPVCLLNCR